MRKIYHLIENTGHGTPEEVDLPGWKKKENTKRKRKRKEKKETVVVLHKMIFRGTSTPKQVDENETNFEDTKV